MLRVNPVLFVLPVMMLSGCAAMNEQECVATDWQSVGFEDGLAGRTEGAIGNYRQACSRYGVTPDLALYREGHSDGVQSFCRPARGFDEGRRGRRYQGVCPTDLEFEFLAAYSEGRQLYELESALRSIDNQVVQRHRRLDYLKQALVASGAQIISDETSTERRAELLLEIASMAKEQGEIEEELIVLESERILREDELMAYQQTLAYGF